MNSTVVFACLTYIVVGAIISLAFALLCYELLWGYFTPSARNKHKRSGIFTLSTFSVLTLVGGALCSICFSFIVWHHIVPAIRFIKSNWTKFLIYFVLVISFVESVLCTIGFGYYVYQEVEKNRLREETNVKQMYVVIESLISDTNEINVDTVTLFILLNNLKNEDRNTFNNIMRILEEKSLSVTDTNK